MQQQRVRNTAKLIWRKFRFESPAKRKINDLCSYGKLFLLSFKLVLTHLAWKKKYNSGTGIETGAAMICRRNRVYQRHKFVALCYCYCKLPNDKSTLRLVTCPFAPAVKYTVLRVAPSLNVFIWQKRRRTTTSLTAIREHFKLAL